MLETIETKSTKKANDYGLIQYTQALTQHDKNLSLADVGTCIFTEYYSSRSHPKLHISHYVDSFNVKCLMVGIMGAHQILTVREVKNG